MNKHTAELLEQHFDTAFAAPDGIKKLRELILTLAMQGKLVPQDPSDQPASELLKEIEAEKQRLVQAGKLKKPKPLPPVSEEEKPYALPQGWGWVKFGDISSYIQRGKGPSYVDFSTHRVISQKCVRWYGLDLEPARYIDPESLEKYEAIRFLQGGDLLWNSTGTGTIGRACLVPHNLNNAELVADSHVTIVRTLTVNNQFLWRWVQSPWVQAGIEKSASGTTNQIELNTSTVVNHLIPLPPLAEQNRIVAKIDELMARCDALEKLRAAQQEQRLTVHAAAIKQLLNIAKPDQHQRAQTFLAEHFGELYTVKENVAELRKAILQLAVMGKLVPQNPDDQPASELLKDIEAEKQRLVKAGKIKKPKPLPPVSEEEKPYALPQGWEWVRLDEIVDIGSGVTKGRNLTGREVVSVPYLRVANVQRGYLDLSIVKEIDLPKSELEKYSLITGDLLITEGGDWDKVGRTCIWRGEVSVCAHQNHVFRARRYIESQSEVWLEKYLNSWPARTYFAAASKQTTNLASINKTQLQRCPIPLPPASEQNFIVARADELMSLCDELDQQIEVANSKQAELLNALIHAQSQAKVEPPVVRPSATITNLADYRAAIGCYTLGKLANAQYFGRTAAAKVLYLAQAHIGLELNLQPEREAAGPLDEWIYDFEREGQGKHWFEVNEKTLASGHSKTEYRCLPALAEPASQAEAVMAPEQKAEFDRLIHALADKTTEEVEIIATLFAVWNDFLIDGIQPTDEQIIIDLRENWHERKTRFAPAKLSQWLDWLRKEHFVPRGLPPRTVQQRQLAI